MKRADLLTVISKAAAEAGCDFIFVREGGSHTVYRFGSQQFTVPRHKEINELTARGILRNLGLR
ncbi:type II toxin-antitoxin system HicA family toxin [Micromonospora sp. NBC_01699]|uniref:type II toxin-antitoxin system HicA family toxin n=1 Tax=Micromonospora sp. NBC_01699 TaxID=2975984 RepID=UPI002E3333DD|nr:type II toxin-antitoxin system HicA family toxin [Micromonospora sp. NBC_01699]